MCRLAYVPFETTAEDKAVIETLFEFLEASFGGHGNGIGYFVDNKPWVFKGSRMTTEKLAGHMVDETVSAIFHTRLASMGSICNENTHPFSYNGVLTAHNGHWSDAAEMAKMLIHADKFSEKRIKDMTDSEVIACLVGNYGFGATDIVDTGVILSLYQDHAKVFVKGDFEYIKTPEGRVFYASEFPRKIVDTWKVEEYFRFDKGSVAKLTADGPILVKGALTKTVPSAWPKYSRSTGQYGEWDDLYGYGFRDPVPPKPPVGSVSFLPKQRSKKAKKIPYQAHDILREVSMYVGFDANPELDAITATTAYSELEYALEELEDELLRILQTRPYNKQNRPWLAEEANAACKSWLNVNKQLISDYDFIKRNIEKSFYGDVEFFGDKFTDGYGNIWVFINGEWRLQTTLTSEELEQLQRGYAEWKTY